MTTRELAKLLRDWPDASPSWLDVGQWLIEIEDPTAEMVCAQLAQRGAPAPDFGIGEEGPLLCWYNVDSLVSVRVAGGKIQVDLRRPEGSLTEELELS